MRYEEMFNDYKRQRFNQISKNSARTTNNDANLKNSVNNKPGGSRYVEIFKADTRTSDGFDETMTDVTSHGIRSPKTTTRNEAISVLENGQLASIPLKTLNFANGGSNQLHPGNQHSVTANNSRV